MSDDTKVAAITGAGSGIGRALAQTFAARGYRVAISDVNEAGLQETVALCAHSPHVSKVDVAKQQEVQAWSEAVLKEFGRVDVVVNNAGVALLQPVHEVSLEDFEWLFQINFWGVVYGTRAFLPHLLENKRGAIVNISSIFGIVGFPNNGSYCASKFAVRGFTETLRHDLKGSGVLVSCVHPGGIKTNIAANGRYRRDPGFSNSKEDAVERFQKAARTTPEQAAKVIVDGIEAKKSRILIGADARFLDRVQRLFPTDYQSVFGFILKRLGVDAKERQSN